MVSTSRALLTTAYCPPISYLSVAKQVDTLYIEQWENYQKGSYRNRMHIGTGNGQLALSVPLQSGKHQRMPIREVRIDYQQPWLKIHRDSIHTAYRSAPFFLDYAPAFFAALDKKPAFLFDLNLLMLDIAFRSWQIKTPIVFTESYNPTTAPEVLDYRHRILPNRSHPKNNHTQQESPTYPQVFDDRNGFLENLSFLDLLFCQGPEGALYLHQFSPVEL